MQRRRTTKSSIKAAQEAAIAEIEKVEAEAKAKAEAEQLQLEKDKEIAAKEKAAAQSKIDNNKPGKSSKTKSNTTGGNKTRIGVKKFDDGEVGEKYNGMKDIGFLVKCMWRDEMKVAKIIARSVKEFEGKVIRRYYLHYLNFNRRMDEWVTEETIQDMETVNAKTDAVNKEDSVSDTESNNSNSTKRKRESLLSDDPNHQGSTTTSSTAPPKETIHEIEPDHDEHEGMDEDAIKEHEEVTKIKNINKIEIGRYVMDTWYFSPFPKELYMDGVTDIMYICEYCLEFYVHRSELLRHRSRCNCENGPPGNEIYRDHRCSMFEIDGGGTEQQHQYAMNLCFIAKLFLDHKTLYFDVDPFLFYVLCEITDYGYQIVGYYSKEKYSEQGYNLACILTLPCYQRKGYGTFLIDFSYALSRKEEKAGSPEKPLSDLGLVSYRSYWCNKVLSVLESLRAEHRSSISIWEIIKLTSFTSDDIVSTLKFMGIFKYHSGGHIFTITDEAIQIAETKFKRVSRPNAVDYSKLHFTPLITTSVKQDKWLLSNLDPGSNPEMNDSTSSI